MAPQSSTSKHLKSLSPAINSLLAKLRRRIRWVVLIEGISTAVAWLAISFWLALAIDYLPITFGFNELSKVSRIMILVLVSSLIAWVLYRLVFRRVFVRLHDSSLALLIEREYPHFNDSLLTTVSRANSSTDEVTADAALLDRTRIEAEKFVPYVDLHDIVTTKPMRRSIIFAAVMISSIVAFALIQPSAMKIASQRLCLLQEKLWPRRCRLELVGLKIKRENPIEGIDELGQLLMAKPGNEFRIAKGSTLTLMIRAEGDQTENQQRLPTNCSMIYRTTDGDQGAQTFKKIGAPRDGFQHYFLDEQPLRGILSDITFYVRGGDHRLGPFTITVVDEPTVISTKLACSFPSYIVDESSMRWTDRTIDWSGQARLPEGTEIIIRSASNKPLTKVYVRDRSDETMQAIQTDGKGFEFSLPRLANPINVEFFLCDTDGLVSEQPHTINIDPIEDQLPIVQTRLTGIGTAVTPDVQIPFTGTIKDDYSLKQTWVEIENSNGELISENMPVSADGKLDAVIDFKKRRQDSGEQYKLVATETSTVDLVVKADDKFNLQASPRTGVGDRYTLDVVSPSQLIRLLEQLEVGQRRRLEQIYVELADARGYLVRSKSKRAKADKKWVEPGDQPTDIREPGEEQNGSDIRQQELRLLFAQRALLQIDKSSREILGSVEAFENIRLQLINNRIDSEDRKKRFSEQIIAPLRLIATTSMQQLSGEIVKLEVRLRDLQSSLGDESVSQSADQLALKTIESSDVVLNQLDTVLNALIKYETQNELLEIVRKMIKQQQSLLERTKKERQRKAFEGLLQ